MHTQKELTKSHAISNEYAIQINDENMIAAFESWLSIAENVEFLNTSEVKGAISDIPFAMFNPVTWVNLKPDRVDAVLGMLTQKAQEKKVALFWTAGLTSKPSDLTQQLSRHGFSYMMDEFWMAMDLADLTVEIPTVENLSITVVEDEKDMLLLTDVAGVCFEMPAEDIQAARNVFNSLLDDHRWTGFIGLLEGKVVSTSMLFCEKDVAGIYCVATLPEARRKGIGYAVTHAAMQEGKRRGCRYSILQASEIGYNVYRKLGFVDYGRNPIYFWAPE